MSDDSSRRRAPSMPIPHLSAIPIGQAHSYHPYGAHSESYDQNIPPYPVTPPHSRHSTYGGAAMPQKPPRYSTSPMPTPSPMSSNGSTYSSPAPAASPAGWPPFTSADIPPFSIRAYRAEQFSVPQGNQYAEIESMVGGGSRFEYPAPPWDRPQEPLRHQHLPQPQQRYLNEDYPRPLSPPNQHFGPYERPQFSTPPRSYPSNYDLGRHPQTPPRPHRTHATTLQSSLSQTIPPPPPPTWPRSIAHSTSGPASTSQSSSGSRQSSVYVSGTSVPYSDEVEYGGSAHRLPEVPVDHPPSLGSRKLGRTGVDGAATVPHLLSPNSAVSGRWLAPGTQSVFESGRRTIYEEPEGILDGSDWTTGHTSRKEGTKRALLIGIMYKEQSSVEELRGCIHDVCLIGQFLIEQGYLPENIRTLTDDVDDRTKWPTRANILTHMDWLVGGAQENDAFFFHFSGHGAQIDDEDGDESEGLDDTIYPVDHEENGSISDDELNRRLVKPLPKGCRLTALVDACHSGTALDLPFQYSSNDECTVLIELIDQKNVMIKGSEADVVSFSSCKDNQLAEDIDCDDLDVGAMTSTFIKAFKDGQTYCQFFNKIGYLMTENQRIQKPQLGTSHKINLDSKFVF